jgi:predicted nucleic acid-binding Zn ribbon protein
MERAGRLIARLKLPAGSVSGEELVRAAWPVAVGKRIASHTRAIALVRSALKVEVEDAIWQRQLYVLRGQILKKLEQIVGPSIVSEIEFRLAVPRRLPQRAERHRATGDDADQIQDPVLRTIYKEYRKRGSA